MGKTTYNKLIELLEKYKNDGEFLEIGFMELQYEISIHVGSDPRTISTAIRTMLDTKLIKDIGNCHFRIK